ncbi:MAG: transposase [Holophaga sp.]|jgi:putative transposase
MRQSNFTEEQIVALLREAEKGEQTIEALAKAKGISEQTFYRWRKKYGGVDAKDLKRMKELEKENASLKRIVGELTLDLAAVKALNAKKW